MKIRGIICYLAATAFLLASCGKTVSNTTGMSYNDKKNGGFQINLNYMKLDQQMWSGEL